MYRQVSKQTKIRILTVSAIVLSVLGVMFWHALPYHVPESVKVPVLPIITEPAAASIGVPVRITIPSIAVDAAIEQVALTTDGSMDVPKDPLNTGWYELGPRPGETGSATIAGHVNWLHGATAVFRDLHKVKPEDTITVLDDSGAVISFVVREIRKYDAAADAMDVFSSHDGKAHLNLITCDGVWDRSTKQYSERLVVFADKK